MSNEYFARQALKELGITRANRSNAEYQALIDAYMRADEANQKLEDEAELAEAQASWDREHELAATSANHEGEQSRLDKPTLDKSIHLTQTSPPLDPQASCAAQASQRWQTSRKQQIMSTAGAPGGGCSREEGQGRQAWQAQNHRHLDA